MRQVYRIDEDGFYIEPVLVHPEKVPVEVLVPNPLYVPPVPDEPDEPPVDPPAEEPHAEGEVTPNE